MYSDNEKKHKISIPSYTLAEELMNSISHGVGALMGLAMLVMCLVRAAQTGDAWKIVSAAIFGATTFLLYIMSYYQ